LSRQSNASESIHIAVHVLAFLSNTRSVSTTDIREHLATLGYTRTPRSIQRLMDDLCDSFDIARDDRSRPFGYRWKSQARGLGLPALADREALVLLLARQHLEPLLPASVLKTLDPMFEEARRRLDPFNGSGHRPLRSWPKKVAVVSQLHPLIPPQLAAGVLDQVSEALQGDLWLDIDYRNFDGESLENKRVMPLALVQQGVRLFLVCRFEGYEDERHLTLHRFTRARCTKQPFERPAFDLRAYVNDGRFGFGKGERIVLRLDVNASVAELLRETPVSSDQQIVPDGAGRFELTATVVRSEQLRWWLRTYGSAVHVLSPPGLLEEGIKDAPVMTSISCFP
jgi:predicted DNA-binding transcriptional regulator YafY